MLPYRADAAAVKEAMNQLQAIKAKHSDLADAQLQCPTQELITRLARHNSKSLSLADYNHCDIDIEIECNTLWLTFRAKVITNSALPV
jgi:hypothetical protein